MKKYLFPSLAVLLGMGLTLTSCSSDDETVGAASNPNAIGFVALTNNAAGTRATAITPSNVNDQMKNFLVWGTLTDGGAYYFGTENAGIQFNNNSGKWDYANAEDVHYWPTGYLNFYAVSPLPAKNAADGYLLNGSTLAYTVPTENAKQIDLMHAYTGNQQKENVTDGKAALQFGHLLSQIVFKAKSKSNTLNVEIKSITIHNVKNGFTFDISKETPTLSLSDNRSNYAVGLASAVTAKSDGVTVDATDANGALLLAPQPLTKWATTSDVPTTTSAADAAGQSYITAEVKITSVNGTNTTYLLGTSSEYANTNIPFGATWEAGKKYTYTLVFGDKDSNNGGGGLDDDGKDQLVPIGFTVTVSDWDEVDNEDITM